MAALLGLEKFLKFGWEAGAVARTARILVVEDEENVRYVVVAALKAAGLEVVEETEGRAGWRRVSEGGLSPDLVVLDVGLPELDGFEVCRRWRAEGVNVPVVFLTARGEQPERLRGLALGGDDYLVKPFSVEELVLRVQAVLRRTVGSGSGSVLRAGSVELDDGARVVRQAGVEVAVSPTEYRLLRYLMENQGLALSKAQILDRVWRYDFVGESTVLETFISSLRKKLETDGERLIHTVRGVGYRLQAGSSR